MIVELRKYPETVEGDVKYEGIFHGAPPLGRSPERPPT
jgi:hypothetical protein